MSKVTKKKQSKEVSRDTKDVMTLVFLFSLIMGIILTTFLASRTVGQNTTTLIHAAGPQ